MNDRRDGWGDVPEKQERRTHARRLTDRVEASFWVERSEGDALTYQRAGNLSAGGLYLESPLPLPRGSMMMLEFQLPGDNTPIRCGGEVRSIKGGDQSGMNIQFFELEEDALRRIVTFVDALQIPDPQLTD